MLMKATGAVLTTFLFVFPGESKADAQNVNAELSPDMIAAVVKFRSCISAGNFQEANRAGKVCGAYFGSKLQPEKLQQCLTKENVSYVGAIKRPDGTVFESLLTFKCEPDSELSMSLRQDRGKYAVAALHDLMP